MQQDLSSRLGAAALTITAAMLLVAVSAFAGTPTLGPDCGAGAAFVGTSSDSAGKLTLGTDPAQTCTLTFELRTPTRPHVRRRMKRLVRGRSPLPRLRRPLQLVRLILGMSAT
jgi:hypothetical protein